ncbi:Rhodanese-like protein [Xylariomycetidae sp. FL0641]|nr:Rhodanese-like protein [Xylariomycetidae sp. FL0641]
MSLITLSSLGRITAEKLRPMLEAAAKQPNPDVAVVDVRDGDYIGGHIKDCLHFESSQLDATMPTLLRRLEGKHSVVFHCMLSQQRGPSAALRYLRELEARGDERAKTQKVYVLDRGFMAWIELYDSDPKARELTEGYRKEIWKPEEMDD